MDAFSSRWLLQSISEHVPPSFAFPRRCRRSIGNRSIRGAPACSAVGRATLKRQDVAAGEIEDGVRTDGGGKDAAVAVDLVAAGSALEDVAAAAAVNDVGARGS